MRRDWLIGVLLAALTLAVYWPVRTHEFIAYDDPEFVTENPQIQSGLSWSTVVYAFTRPLVGNWHPVTTLSHALDCELFGLRPGPPHLVNAAIHALNVLLLFMLLQRLTRDWPVSLTGSQWSPTTDSKSDGGTEFPKTWACLIISCVFAFHPLRVESVAWLAERKDLLSGLFFFLSLWTYVCYAGDPAMASSRWNAAVNRPTPRRRFWIFYAVSLLSFALGLMSKPMLVTLPFVLVLLDYWPLQRFRMSDFRSQHSNIRRLVLEKVPFLLLSILDSWITLSVQARAGATRVLQGITWPERLGNAASSYLRYLGKLFWPTDLAIVYPHPARHYYSNDQWPDWELALAALWLVVVSIFCLVELRKRPYLAVGWFWFLGMLVPVIGIVQVGEQAMADRYSYLPTIGLVVGLVFWCQEGLFRWRGKSNRPITVSQISSVGPGEPTSAGMPRPWANGLGIVGASVLLLTLVCLTRHQLGFWGSTVSLFDHAIAVTADNPSAQFAMGVGLERSGETSKAAVRYRVAVGIDPNYTKAYYNLGQILRKAGWWQQAADNYLAAARLNPGDLATHLNLASVLPRLGRAQEAVQHFNEALRLDPASIEGLNNLAWLLATCPENEVRNGAQAVQLAERACGLTSFRAPVLLGTLAAAYAEAGRYMDAVATAQRACAVAAEAGDSETAAKNQELLQLYLANRPCRSPQ